ncbi:unnamed protein product [Phytophthora fragariaefolia]|uniref:Unnamed protein product n=1 Tax=Phytophthora fragariaefolia TaxID=1490495 RepID=A0A9W6YNI2_9STRA|nr:unnamed protein product [Phytophthora fragariaefolia]
MEANPLCSCSRDDGGREILVDNGASVEPDIVNGKWPAQLAVEFGNMDMYRYLKEIREIDANQLVADIAVDVLEVLFDPDDDYNTEGVWLDTPVEMKKPIGSVNFLEELGRWSNLNHPHVVRLYGVCRGNPTFNTGPSFVYEQPTQGTLLEYIKMLGSTATHAEVWNKLYEAALGLQYLHDRNIIHGDISCYSIVIAANGAAKIRNLGSENNPSRYHLEWTAPEILAGLPPSFETDVYAFGITIVEAMKETQSIWGIHGLELQDAISSGLLPQKPRIMTAYQWKLIEHMCSFDPPKRFSLREIVRELEVITCEYDMNREGNSLSSIELEETANDAWSTVSDILDQTGGPTEIINPMHADVYARLVSVFDQLNGSPVTRVLEQFSQIVKLFRRRIQGTGTEGAGECRLALSRQIAEDVFVLNNALDLFMDGIGLARTANLHKWKLQWSFRQTEQQQEILNRLLEEPHLLDDFKTENNLDESLAYLSFELSRYPTSYTNDRYVDFSRVASSIKALADSKCANWFIPAYEVDFDRFNEFSRRAFGKVFHGRWKRSEVVVKTVRLRNKEDQAAFLNEVEIWHKLYHPHVLQLFWGLPH